MAEPFDPGSETLQTALPLMATANTDPIVAGGPSSSTNLNQLRDALLTDVSELDRRTADTAGRITSTNAILGAQLTALSARFNSLVARLPATSGRWLADFYTSQFLDAQNGAEVNTTYGQATLPVLSTQEKLVGKDSRDRVWIPQGTAVHYSYAGSVPQEIDWIFDDGSVAALDGRADTAWWLTRPSSGAVWVRVRLPANLNANKLANAILLHPFPTLSFDLLSVEYRNPAGSWTAADLTYLTGYNSSTTTVQWFGPLRLIIPQSPVTEVRLKLSTAGQWGFNRLAVQQLSFAPAATLIVDFLGYSPGALGSVRLLGKDQDRLSYLTTGINGTLASVALTQESANNSPLLTGIEART